MDYEVIEMQKMEPVPLNSEAEIKNVIYIENDDVLEQSSDIGTEAQEMNNRGRGTRKSQVSNVSSVLSNSESPNTAGMVLGDTGDHHFPKS
jgi:hypothetical protein